MNNFKVWCKDFNEWEKDYTLLGQDGAIYHINHGGGLISIRPENHIIVWPSGYKDESDTMIYDGDVIKFEWMHGRYTTAIVEKDYFMGSDDMGYDVTGYRDFGMYGPPTIIGNIYENPELKNKKLRDKL